MTGTDPVAKPPCAFYAVCDSRFFPGLVALLNSLRLLGHDEPTFILDTGLTPDQRSRLADHVTLIPAPRPDASVLLTPLGPSMHPAEIQVLIDVDIIVTQPLTELIEAARAGQIVGVVDDPPIHDRFFREWEQMLDMPGLCPRPYLNAGQLVVPERLGQKLFPLWMNAQEKVDLKDTRYGRGQLSDPFYFADQDVLNAILAGHFEPGEILTIEHRLAPYPPFPGLRLIDEQRLVCRYQDGVQPFVLHHILAKPWLKATRSTIYLQLLRRLLLGSDVALRMAPSELPLRLRGGRLAALDRRRANLQVMIYHNFRRQLGKLETRTRARRLAAWTSSRFQPMS
jgi:hypothetical protein